MKLCLLCEGAKEDAAIDLMRQTIAGTSYEGKVYLTGGFVRDELLGKQSKDIDLVIDEEDGGIRFATWICQKLGIYKENSNPVIYPKFGTAMFTFRNIAHLGEDLSGLDIECVKPRKDIGATGGSRKDVVTAQGTMKDDAERRDLTINTLYRNISTGQILDPTGMGMEDLKAKRIRTPINPDETFADPPKGDPLRMLRAIRFFAKFGYDIDPSVISGIKKNHNKMADISMERRRDEFSKMLLSDRAVEALDLLIETGLIDYIVPELKDLIGLAQGIYHNKDAYGHTMDVLKASPPRLIARLSALLHDIAKPETREPHPRKEYQFLDHQVVGAEKAANILRRLKYPNDIISSVAAVVGNHMGLRSGRHGEISDKTLRRFARKCGSAEALQDALDLMRADYEAHPGSSQDKFTNILKRYEELGQSGEEVGGKQTVLTGHDIMKEFNVPPGPHIGAMINYVQELYEEDPDIDKATALLKLKEKFNPNEEE